MYPEIVLGVISVTLLIYYYYFSHASKVHKFARHVGGPKGVPFMGNAIDFIKNSTNLLQFISKWTTQYGERLVFFVGPKMIFLNSNPEDLEKILNSQEMITKSDDYNYVKAWLGEGLITSTGAHWFYRRKLITPTFSFSVLERFIAPINVHAKVLSDVLAKHFVHDKANNYIDIFSPISRCALDIICETSMGIQLNAQAELGSSMSYANAVNRLGELFHYRQVRPWLLNEFMWGMTSEKREELACLNTIHSFVDNVIANRKRLYQCQNYSNEILKEEEDYTEAGGKARLAMLDMLIQAQKSGSDITDTGIREETSSFMFAGYDTISAALSFCLFNLGNNLEVQEKLQHEVDKIFQEDKFRNITSADIKEMKYLECCIKESLRLFPSVPVIGRQAISEFRLDSETVIPAGTQIYIPFIVLQRNAKYFAQPERFIPERFLTENSTRFTYLPFSAGPRNCIGQKLAMMEAKIILATIARRFHIKSQHKPDFSNLLSEIVLKSKGGIQISLQER